MRLKDGEVEVEVGDFWLSGVFSEMDLQPGECQGTYVIRRGDGTLSFVPEPWFRDLAPTEQEKGMGDEFLAAVEAQL